jgi:hypothetical protein
MGRIGEGVLDDFGNFRVSSKVTFLDQFNEDRIEIAVSKLALSPSQSGAKSQREPVRLAPPSYTR